MMSAVEGEDYVPDWPDAACRDDDPEVWFPTSMASPEVVDPLREVCWPCPRRDDCLAYAIEHREDFGIWGGMTDSQRRRIRAGRTTAAREWDSYHRRVERQTRRDLIRRISRTGDQAAAVAHAQEIMAEVADIYGLTTDDLISTASDRNTIEARKLAMRWVRHITGLSYTSIGVLFDRHHTTVMSAVSETRTR